MAAGPRTRKQVTLLSETKKHHFCSPSLQTTVKKDESEVPPGAKKWRLNENSNPSQTRGNHGGYAGELEDGGEKGWKHWKRGEEKFRNFPFINRFYQVAAGPECCGRGASVPRSDRDERPCSGEGKEKDPVATGHRLTDIELNGFIKGRGKEGSTLVPAQD